MLRLLLYLFLFPSLANAEDNALFTYATLRTSMGEVRLKLFKKDAPRTVENFIGLATGSKPFRDVKTGKKVKDTPFYKDMIFHKVHPELGIQTGCPWGNGKGWPGFTINNEKNDIQFIKAYLVAMALIENNDNSVGSQFFITTNETPHLNGKYTVFGEVVQGKHVVDKIARVRRDSMMKPLKPIKLFEVVIEQ